MKQTEVLLVAGTHGNEINGIWLIDQYIKKPESIRRRGINVSTVIANPCARKKVVRYIDRDLNRSFNPKLLSSHLAQDDYEIQRAKELLTLFGSKSEKPISIVIDLHSTTAAMGSSIVIYGRRPTDLALAGLIQNRLNLPIYLHEGDNSQTGFLVEKWPCGLVIEIGPVSQGVLKADIIKQNIIAIETCLSELQMVKSGEASFPKEVVIHKHLKSLDFPRDISGNILGYLHPDIEDKNWKVINKGDILFITFDGKDILFIDNDLPQSVIPVFINEASYLEKGIAMSLTSKEILPFNSSWSKSLIDLVL